MHKTLPHVPPAATWYCRDSCSQITSSAVNPIPATAGREGLVRTSLLLGIRFTFQPDMNERFFFMFDRIQLREIHLVSDGFHVDHWEIVLQGSQKSSQR